MPFASLSVVVTAAPLYRLYPPSKSPSLEGDLLSRAGRAPGGDRKAVGIGCIGLGSMYTLPNAFCKSVGCSYGLRRYTDYTLPLNLPPREGDLQSRAVRAPIGTRRQMVFNRIGRRSVHTIGRASCNSAGLSYGLRRYTDYTLPLNLPPREGDLQSRAVRAPIGTRRQMVFNRIGRRSVHTIGRASCNSAGLSYGLRRYTDYTLPLNLPPREGDLQSRAVRAPIGTRRQMVFNRIGRRSVHTIGRASCKSDVRVRRGRSARLSYKTQRVGCGLFDEYVVREGVAAV